MIHRWSVAKTQENTQDNKGQNNNLDTAIYHEQCYVVDNYPSQAPEKPDRMHYDLHVKVHF